MLIQCNGCGILWPRTGFYERGDKKGKLPRQPCKLCTQKHKKPKKYTDKTRQSITAWRRKRREAMITRLGGKCVACGNSDHRVLHFDHKEPENKAFTIAFGIAASGNKALIREVDKCQLLCANCHTLKTWHV